MVLLHLLLPMGWVPEGMCGEAAIPWRLHEYNAKQITKSLQDACLHLYFCKHSSIKYKWAFQGCVFSSGMSVYFIVVIGKLVPLGSGKQERYLFLSSSPPPPPTSTLFFFSCFVCWVVTVQWPFPSKLPLYMQHKWNLKHIINLSSCRLPIGALLDSHLCFF